MFINHTNCHGPLVLLPLSLSVWMCGGILLGSPSSSWTHLKQSSSPVCDVNTCFIKDFLDLTHSKASPLYIPLLKVIIRVFAFSLESYLWVHPLREPGHHDLESAYGWTYHDISMLS